VYEGGNYAQVSGSGESRKDRLVKDTVQGKKPVGAISRTSDVMPEDQKTTSARITNSLHHQSKKIGHLLSSKLDYLSETLGQDNS